MLFAFRFKRHNVLKFYKPLLPHSRCLAKRPSKITVHERLNSEGVNLRDVLKNVSFSAKSVGKSYQKSVSHTRTAKKNKQENVADIIKGSSSNTKPNLGKLLSKDIESESSPNIEQKIKNNKLITEVANILSSTNSDQISIEKDLRSMLSQSISVQPPTNIDVPTKKSASKLKDPQINFDLEVTHGQDLDIKSVLTKGVKTDHSHREKHSSSVKINHSAYTPGSLFNFERLGIFSKHQKTKDLPRAPIHESDLFDEAEAAKFIPRNGFDEMIKLTNEGKLWHFPIDNEQDIGSEADVDFFEHIFIDEYLSGKFRKDGPVWDFMQLVSLGLSKNPYMTIEMKRRQIDLYKEYFDSKMDTLLKAQAIEELS